MFKLILRDMLSAQLECRMQVAAFTSDRVVLAHLSSTLWSHLVKESRFHLCMPFPELQVQLAPASRSDNFPTPLHDPLLSRSA